MRLIGRLAAVSLLALGTLPLAVSPAMAASAPLNDTLSGAEIIGALPFAETLDTTSATTDATDTEANAKCGAPVTLGSVWYDYTPAVDGAIVVDVSQSSYEAGVIIVTGAQGNLALDACGPLAVSDAVFAGVTYHILAFSDTPGINGGVLKISVDVAPPPPDISVTVNPVGHVNQKTGVVTLSGSFSCSGRGDFGDISGTLSQQVGRVTISGMFDVMAPTCDGQTYAWTAQLVGDNGRFAGGKSAAFAWAFECGPVYCSEGFAEQKVQLKR